MSEEKSTLVEEEKQPTIEDETRVDEFDVNMFAAMGHKDLLPDSTVTIYNEFKRRKDMIHPSRLTPEGFAFVSILGDMAAGRFDPSAKKKPDKKK